MKEFETLVQLDFISLGSTLFSIMACIIAIYTIIGKFSEIIGKPVRWVRKNKEFIELTQQNARDIKELSEQHKNDTCQSIKHDEMIRSDLQKLTKMFTDKQINDYRWEIINLADKISNGKNISKECYRHALATYEKYEQIIEDNLLVNGEVEISIKIIKDSYQDKLKLGF